MTEYTVLIVGADDRWWTTMSLQERKDGYAQYAKFNEALVAGGHEILGGGELTSTAEAQVDPRRRRRPPPRGRTPRPRSGSAATTRSAPTTSTGCVECCQIIARTGDGVEVRRQRRAGGPALVKRYLVLIAYAESDYDNASAEVQQYYMDAHDAFSAYVAEHGEELSSAALAGPEEATTIRHVEGSATVSDGPFVETVESIGGYYDVRLPDLDAAIAAASLLPSSYSVEIRPTIKIEM